MDSVWQLVDDLIAALDDASERIQDSELMVDVQNFVERARLLKEIDDVSMGKA